VETMGAWGTSIFSNDIALDIKREYQTLLAFGTPEDEAYQLVKDKFLLGKGEELGMAQMIIRMLNDGKPEERMALIAKNYFGCDNALEILRQWQALVASGMSEEDAFDVVKIHFMRKSIHDEDDPDFWFAMAAIQQKYGILLPEVKDNALRCIDDGVDARNWEGAEKKVIKAREKVLADLKEKLLAPPLPKRKLSKPSIQKPRWQIGDIVASQMVSSVDTNEWFYNKYVLYRVVQLERTSVSLLKPDLAYDEWVHGALYNWIGDELPTQFVLEELDFYRCDIYDMVNKIEPMSMYWIPRYERFTLFQRDGNYSMPNENDIHFHATGNNIFSVLSRIDSPFKSLYEKYKS